MPCRFRTSMRARAFSSVGYTGRTSVMALTDGDVEFPGLDPGHERHPALGVGEHGEAVTVARVADADDTVAELEELHAVPGCAVRRPAPPARRGHSTSPNSASR